jgi:hypothetical protein
MKKIVKLFVAVSVLLSGFLILNPIIVYFVGMLFPKWLNQEFNQENPHNEFVEAFLIALQWQFWIQKLLPWKQRKIFVEGNFYKASAKDRIHLSLEKPALFFSLSPTEKDDAFKRGTRENQFYWATKSDKLSDIMLRKICENFSTEEITKSLEGKPIFLSQFKIMLEYTLDFPTILRNKTLKDDHILEMAKNPIHSYYLCRILENQGIGLKSEDKLWEICSQNGQIEAVLEALKVRRQKNLMAKGCKDINEFTELCAEGLCIDAQKEMKFWQYSIFHNMGGKLSSEAILHFLQTQNKEISRQIINYQEPALQEEFVQQMIYGSDKLFSFFIKMKNEQTPSTKKADV